MRLIINTFENIPGKNYLKKQQWFKKKKLNDFSIKISTAWMDKVAFKDLPSCPTALELTSPHASPRKKSKII